jgi:hypothetical protein
MTITAQELSTLKVGKNHGDSGVLPTNELEGFLRARFALSRADLERLRPEQRVEALQQFHRSRSKDLNDAVSLAFAANHDIQPRETDHDLFPVETLRELDAELLKSTELERQRPPRLENPENSFRWPSLLYQYLNPLLTKGKDLVDADIWEAHTDLHSEALCRKLDGLWTAEIALKGDQANLFKVLCVAVKKPLAVVFALTMVERLTAFLLPLVLEQFLVWYADPDADPAVGYLLAVALGIVPLCGFVCTQLGNHKENLITAGLCSMLRQFVFSQVLNHFHGPNLQIDSNNPRQVLLSSLATVSHFTTGYINNLMAVDANKARPC